MKLKLKMSMLAGALAFGIAGQAGAVTFSDLYLTVIDSTNGTLYTRDLGAVSGGTISGTNTATLAAASMGNNTWSADASLASFLGAAGSDGLVWNVTSSFTGSTGFNLSAVAVTSALASVPTAQKNGTVNTAAANFGFYYNGMTAYATLNSDGLLSGSTAATPTLLSESQTGNSNVKFSTVANIGSSMDMFYVTPSSTSSIANAAWTTFGGANADVWTLGSNGTLSVAAVAAVPEPGEWMLMLSGFGLIGFIANRRKKSGGALTFA